MEPARGAARAAPHPPPPAHLPIRLPPSAAPCAVGRAHRASPPVLPHARGAAASPSWPRSSNLPHVAAAPNLPPSFPKWQLQSRAGRGAQIEGLSTVHGRQSAQRPHRAADERECARQAVGALPRRHRHRRRRQGHPVRGDAAGPNAPAWAPNPGHAATPWEHPALAPRRPSPYSARLRWQVARPRPPTRADFGHRCGRGARALEGAREGVGQCGGGHSRGEAEGWEGGELAPNLLRTKLTPHGRRTKLTPFGRRGRRRARAAGRRSPASTERSF